MKKLKGIILLLIIVCYKSTSQTTNSPYSVFGAGQIENRGFGVNESMGGTGFALSSGQFLNRLNPASYSGIDSLSFLYEIGMFGKYSTCQSSSLWQNKIDGNISYLAIGFRAQPWWSISAGILPYSSMGYEIFSYDNIDGTSTNYAKMFSGSGSINQAYIGNSIRPFKNFSLGLHTAYIFGSFNQSESAIMTSDFEDYAIKKTTYINAVKFDYGLQYFVEVKKWRYGIGLVYGNHKDLNTRSNLVFGYATDTVEISQKDNSNFIIPDNLGFGISASCNERFTIAFDYETNKWSDGHFSNTMLKTRDSERFSMGIEYSPGKNLHKVIGYKKLNYRLGGSYNESYLVIDNTPINSKSLTLGVGIPLERKLSMINLSIEAGSLGTLKNQLIRENYYQLNINFTLHDIWFQKPKYD